MIFSNNEGLFSNKCFDNQLIYIYRAASISNDDVLRLCPLSDHITPSTQTEDTVAGTSVQNDILLAQQMHVYNEPGNCQLFKEPSRNSFGRATARKKVVYF